MLRSLCLFAWLGGLINAGISDQVSYHGQEVWRVVPASAQVLHILNDMGDNFQLDFWKDPVAIGRPVDFRVMPNQADGVREMLEENGIFDYDVYITDMQALIDAQKQSRTSNRDRSQGKATSRTVATFDYGVYHTADEIYEWIDMVANEFPTIAKRQQIGITYQGRPMYALEFKNPATPGPKPIIFVDALIHCREWISAAALMFIFKEMLTNPDYAHMMAEVDYYYVPMINIDGYDETWSGDRLWRKTRSTGPSSLCLGVDGNRNWNAHWSARGASQFPCMYTYYGPTPASETEIRHLANYVMGLGAGRISAYQTTHSYSQLILYPYGWTAEPCEDDDVLNITGKLMHDAMFAVHQKYYTWGGSAATLYVSSGSTTDWTYDVAKVKLTYTFELRDEGRYGFLLPADQIIPNGEEYLAGMEVLKNYVVENYEGSGGGTV